MHFLDLKKLYGHHKCVCMCTLTFSMARLPPEREADILSPATWDSAG